MENVMKCNEIIFDENLEMYVQPNNFTKEICLTLSDGLSASEEELTDEYKEKIVSFINNIQDWYNKSVNAVLNYAKQTYEIEAKQEDVRLINIFVLFEQDEDGLFGLEFRTEFDVEHGCGLKIKGKKENYEITNIGTGDVAFC
jgi:hypothetical protein